PPPPCTYFCFTWTRTNGPADAAACTLLASSLLQMAQSASYGLTPSGFTCKGVNAAKSEVTACADFALEADARAFGDFFANQGGFDDLALITGFGPAYAIGPNGAPVCNPSKFFAELTTELTGAVCDNWQKESACAPPATDTFPYCKCEPGTRAKTPYALTYTRKYTKAGANYYCFNVQVNRTQCGSSKCCSMDLDKIEWLSNEENCMGAAMGFTVTTKPGDLKSPVWSRVPDTSFSPAKTFGIFKTNSLDLNVGNANGAEVCIALRSNGNCPTLEQFCYQGDTVGCQYAIFDRADAGAGCCAEDWAVGKFGHFDRRLFRRMI
ncbi:hypothetical protein TSOC_014893, partial [Tetrabaena socialis]